MNLLNKYRFGIGLMLLFLISACQSKTASDELFNYAKEQSKGNTIYFNG